LRDVGWTLPKFAHDGLDRERNLFRWFEGVVCTGDQEKSKANPTVNSTSTANPLCSSSVHAPICAPTGLFVLISHENWCLGLP
jgi:hypothetical protein